jgi:hypothetical protein
MGQAVDPRVFFRWRIGLPGAPTPPQERLAQVAERASAPLLAPAPAASGVLAGDCRERSVLRTNGQDVVAKPIVHEGIVTRSRGRDTKRHGMAR